MGSVYDRNKDYKGRQPNYWIYYMGPPGYGRVREPGCRSNHRATRQFLRQREQEVRDGTWKPLAFKQKFSFKEYAERWIADRTSTGRIVTADLDASRLRLHIYPIIGDKPLDRITRFDIKSMVETLGRKKSKATGRTLAARTILHLYQVTRMVFVAAFEEEPPLITYNPCSLKYRKDELPEKRDADPNWRPNAVYSRAEVEALISDPRIPDDRRTFYALTLLTGMRFGEVAGRRWRDYDERARPLGRLIIATQYDGKPLKTGAPVHPTLADILTEWRMKGFPFFFGRNPHPEDFIVPSRRDQVRSQNQMLHQLHRDLARLGFRKRNLHDMRSTLITLGQTDGCNREVLETITHAAKGKVFDGYARFNWQTKCDELAKLQVYQTGFPNGVRPHFTPQFGFLKSQPIEIIEQSRWRRRESNQCGLTTLTRRNHAILHRNVSE